MRWSAGLLAMGVLVGATCGTTTPEAGITDDRAARILLAGDVSLGRGLADVVRHDPGSVFEDLTLVIGTADLAAANLESPLTTRAHLGDERYDLRADPSSADLLATAGFDVIGLANNHAGDAGPGTVLDTIAALEAAELIPVGGGTESEAFAPVIVDVDGVSVGLVAFDATGDGPSASPSSPGVATWDPVTAQATVADLRDDVDVVVVGVHGGVEYLAVPDVTMREIGRVLAAAGADVVWGHGAHIVQPIELVDADGDGRPTVVATSLGNLVFDQRRPPRDAGAVLELLVDGTGVTALRLGDTRMRQGRVRFDDWRLPDGDATLLDGAWWQLAGRAERTEPRAGPNRLPAGDVVAAALGDLDGDREEELVVSFRRPVSAAPLHDLLPDVAWSDARGRSAHLGVFDPVDLSSRWVASAMVRPVAELAVCDGAIAVAYDALDDPRITGVGAWTWNGFGWDEAPDLEGAHEIGCADVDGDGRSDPVVRAR